MSRALVKMRVDSSAQPYAFMPLLCHTPAWIRLIGRNVLDTGETLVAELMRSTAQRNVTCNCRCGFQMNDAAAQHFWYMCPEPHSCTFASRALGGQAITSWSPRCQVPRGAASGESGS